MILIDQTDGRIHFSFFLIHHLHTDQTTTLICYLLLHRVLHADEHHERKLVLTDSVPNRCETIHIRYVVPASGRNPVKYIHVFYETCTNFYKL